MSQQTAVLVALQASDLLKASIPEVYRRYGRWLEANETLAISGAQCGWYLSHKDEVCVFHVDYAQNWVKALVTPLGHYRVFSSGGSVAVLRVAADIQKGLYKYRESMANLRALAEDE